MPVSWPPPPTDLIGEIPGGWLDRCCEAMAKSKVGLKHAKIVRASAHSNARTGIVKDCLSRKSWATRKSMNVLPEMLKLCFRILGT